MTLELQGKVAMVTGASKGLGQDLALSLAQAGADIVIVGRDPAGARATADAIEDLGRRCIVALADVTDEAALGTAVAGAIGQVGRIDILVCVAGVSSPRRPVWQSTAADFHACFDVNVLGVMLAMGQVLPGMVAQKSGRVIVIGGTYGHKGVALSAIYAASKWALRGLAKSAALEVGFAGVTVNVVAPGGVDGPRLRSLFQASADASGESFEDVRGRFTAKTALGDLVSSADIAAAVVYLASERGRMVTGQDIIVDAGTIV
jgi:NAD(P)-dependent dehydrogenase (short-subunit alcohol dehydrogenase family)